MMEFEKEWLVNRLKEVEPAINSQTLIPIQSHFWFTGKRLLAFSGHIAISIGCPTEFTGAVPVTLLAILESTKANKIEFDQDDKTLKIKAASARFKFAMMPPEDFIFKMPMAKEESVPFAVDVGRFMQAMEMCMRSIGNDTSNPDLLGVTMINDAKAKRVLLFSTDRATISHGSAKYKGELDFERVILKTDFCKQLLRIARGATKLNLEITDKYACLRHEGTTLLGTLEPLDNPLDFAAQVSGIMSSSTKQKTVPVPEKFRGMLERACIITDGAVDKTKTKVIIKTSDDRKKTVISLTSHSERGEAYDSTTIETGGQPDLTCHIDAHRVLDGLDSFDRMTFSKENECVAMITNQDEKDDLVYLVSTTGN